MAQSNYNNLSLTHEFNFLSDCCEYALNAPKVRSDANVAFAIDLRAPAAKLWPHSGSFYPQATAITLPVVVNRSPVF